MATVDTVTYRDWVVMDGEPRPEPAYGEAEARRRRLGVVAEPAASEAPAWQHVPDPDEDDADHGDLC